VQGNETLGKPSPTMGEKKQIRETKEKQISNGEEEAKTSKETYTMARR